MSPRRSARRGFADHAKVDALAAAAEFLDDALHAVAIDRAFLVAGQQQRHRAAMIRIRGDERFQRQRHRRDTAFHVRRTAAV